MKKKMNRVAPALAVAGLMALVMGCASGAPATPTPTVMPTSALVPRVPAIAFDKLWVELGTVARDQQGVQTFLVMNRGDKPLQVGQVTIQVEQGCDAAEAVEGGTEIQPGKAILLPIKLGQHRELGPHKLLMKVTSNDPAMPLATLRLYFDVAEGPPAPESGPRLRVDKEVVAIGTVPFDWPLYEQFTLRNDGDAPLVLEVPPVARVEAGC